MKYWNNYTLTSKSILIIGFILVLYGKMCRLVGIYFFWESSYLGFTTILIGFLTVLFNRIIRNTDEKNKSIGEKIGIGVISLVLLTQGILFVIFPNSNAYKAAKVFLENNAEIKQEIGDVMSITIKPYGGISMQTQNGFESGTANLELIVKGSKKFKDLSTLVIKEAETDWTVEGIE